MNFVINSSESKNFLLLQERRRLLRFVLGWAISNTMDAALVHEALDMAEKNGRQLPGIFNTDQGSQYTSAHWTGRLHKLGIQVSMDGKGRWMDNLFIERLWRSLKYEDV